MKLVIPRSGEGSIWLRQIVAPPSRLKAPKAEGWLAREARWRRVAVQGVLPPAADQRRPQRMSS